MNAVLTKAEFAHRREHFKPTGADTYIATFQYNGKVRFGEIAEVRDNNVLLNLIEEDGLPYTATHPKQFTFDKIESDVEITKVGI